MRILGLLHVDEILREQQFLVHGPSVQEYVRGQSDESILEC